MWLLASKPDASFGFGHMFTKHGPSLPLKQIENNQTKYGLANTGSQYNGLYCDQQDLRCDVRVGWLVKSETQFCARMRHRVQKV